jgi:hypothetical protein
MFSFLVGAIVMIVFTRVELNYVKNSYGAFLDYLGGGESRDIFRELTSTLRSIEHENRVRDKDMTYLFNLLSNCVQKVGIVRYNAFHNIGSDQSFSVALLDSEDNGIVMSSIYGRDSSTTYAKPIRYGASDYVLTEEEMDAIGIARKYFIDKSYFNRR